jgi:hypothetical protein
MGIKHGHHCFDVSAESHRFAPLPTIACTTWGESP